MKQILRSLTPPVLWQAMARLAPGRAMVQEPAEWEHVPEGWRALPGARGWNDPSIARAYRERWPQFASLVEGTGPLGLSMETAENTGTHPVLHNIVMTFAYALERAAAGRAVASVLDWGGGIGHYSLLARALFPELTLDYHCRDQPMLGELAREVLPEVRFHTEDGCLERRYDLVMASSSLHYDEDWRARFFLLAAASAGYLFITRTPVVQRVPSYVFLQRPHRHGYHTEYLAWCLNRSELLESAAGAGMELVREFVTEAAPTIQGAPEPCEFRGFLLRRKAPGSP